MASARRPRAREVGIRIGTGLPGPLNAITDVAGVLVGHETIVEGESVRTGVTAILPHGGNLFQEKVPGAVFVANGFGKLAGVTQIQELGTIETPIVLTNTLAIAAGIDGILTHTLNQPGNELVRSVNAVVGETNDGVLSDIRGRHVKAEHVLRAIHNARSGPIEEGNVGGGTGDICFGYKAGIGTASRVLDAGDGGFTLGVIVQTNFDGDLTIDGVPIGRLLADSRDETREQGSCMIVLATDAPLDARSLERVATRAFMGLARTGGVASNGSGDYVIAFSTASECRIPHESKEKVRQSATLDAWSLTPLFRSAIEATEEAIVNSLFAAADMTGHHGKTIRALPLDEVIQLLREHRRIAPS